MKRRRTLKISAALSGIVLLLLFGPMLAFDLIGAVTTCRDSLGSRLMLGKIRPPVSGANYRTYCYLCVPALRTYGNRRAVEATVSAYEKLAEVRPQMNFVYGEIGFPWGGPFLPHRTHQDGLSFDFMVTLKEGKSLPMHLFNRFGYDVEFDDQGRSEFGTIDFEAITAHLLVLDEEARALGGGIERVYFAPDLQDELFATPRGAELQDRVSFNRYQDLWRHDEHYHVSFDFPCQ